MSHRLAIFDLDGTLVDSRHDLADAGNAARAVLGLPALPIEAVTTMVGDGAATLLERLTPGRSPAERATAMTAFRHDYATRLTNHTTAYAGVPEVLAELHRLGWKIACATNKPAVFARPILERLQLPVEALHGGEGARKPDPGPLFELIRQCSASPATTWMIGDHRTDLQAALNAAVRSVWCAWGFGQRDGLPADAVAQQPQDLLGILADG